MINNNKIGVYDSGVGGLTVYEKLKKLMPNENYVYYGDLKNSPYGEKTKEQLIQYAEDIFKFFIKKDVKCIVMACNTTSAMAYEALRDKYDIKVYPIVQACANVLSLLEIDSLGVFATPVTINSHIYKSEIYKYNKDMQVFELACPEWVKIVESGMIEEPSTKDFVKKYLDKMMENKPDKIVLGCTHYPYLRRVLSDVLGNDIFIDPSIIFSNYIKYDLEKHNMLNTSVENGSEEFFVSANSKEFQNAAKMFYELKEAPSLVEFAGV